MTIEQAIKSLENIVEYWSCKPTEQQAAELAITALKEQQERKEGCEYCNTENNRYLTGDVYLASTNFFGLNRQRVITSQDGSEYKVLLYCPICGRKLGENNG